MKSRNFDDRARLVSLILRAFSALLCFGVLFVPFGTGLRSVVSSESGSVITNYGPSFSFIFGGEITTGRVSYDVNHISAINTVSYCLAILSLLILVVFFVFRKKPIFKWGVLGASASSLASAILALCSHESAATTLSDSILGKRSDSVVATMIRNTNLQFGIWGMAVFGFAITALLLASFIFDGTVNEIKAKMLTK